MCNDNYPGILPHGPLVEVFENVFMVTGSVMLRPGIRISRNMTVVREGKSLTLISAVRLDEDGLTSLEALGEVEHVVKLSTFHGMDDKFYVDKYGAKMWAMHGMEHSPGLETGEVLAKDNLPLQSATLFTFETSKKPEAILFLEQNNESIAIACDSLQNWTEVDAYFNEEGGKKLSAWGFIKPANIGPGWFGTCQPHMSDFQRLLEIPFEHMLSAHGAPLKGGARDAFIATVQRFYPAS